MNRSRSAAAVLAISLLFGPTAAIAQDGYETGSPARTKERGEKAGSFIKIEPGAGGVAESTAISLDAIAGSPAKYEGKTLARKVVLTTGAREEDGAFTIGVADSATGRRVEPGLHDGGIGFFVAAAMANKMNKKAERGASALVTFTVAKLPVPGQQCWAAIVSRIDVLDSNGAVTATIEQR